MDEKKRNIIDLYEEDFVKIDSTGLAGDLFDAIPANLSNNASRYILSNAREGIRGDKAINLLPDMLSSFTINIAYHANDPNVGLPLTKNPGKYKLFTSDTGIFITLAFKDKKYTDNIIYDRLLSDKLDTNLGYIYENMIAQILASKGYNLFYYTLRCDNSNHMHEIDFIISEGTKIVPIEVKSGNYRFHKSIDDFCQKFSNWVKQPYLIHTKDYKKEGGLTFVPIYWVPFM